MRLWHTTSSGLRGAAQPTPSLDYARNYALFAGTKGVGGRRRGWVGFIAPAGLSMGPRAKCDTKISYP